MLSERWSANPSFILQPGEDPTVPQCLFSETTLLQANFAPNLNSSASVHLSHFPHFRTFRHVV